MPPKVHTEDYYRILEIKSTATPEELTKAFRVLALKRHPDKNRENGATQAFQLLNQAYEILKDPVQRRSYDSVDYPRIIQLSRFADAEALLSSMKKGTQPDASKQAPKPESKSRFNAPQQAPKPKNKSRFGSAQQAQSQPGSSKQAPKTEGRRSASPEQAEFQRGPPNQAPKTDRKDNRETKPQWESRQFKFPNPESFFTDCNGSSSKRENSEPGSRDYIGKESGVSFHLSAIMIERGKKEVRCQDNDDDFHRKAVQVAFDDFAADLREKWKSNFPLSDELVKAVWRTNPESIAYRAKEEDAWRDRRRGYFRNAFPELLESKERLPKAWDALWDAFSKDFSVKNQDAMEERARREEAKEAKATRARWRSEQPEQFADDDYVGARKEDKWFGMGNNWTGDREHDNWDGYRSKMAEAADAVWEKEKREKADKARAQELDAALRAKWDKKMKKDVEGDTKMSGV